MEFASSMINIYKATAQLLQNLYLSTTSCHLCNQRCQQAKQLCEYCINDLSKFNYSSSRGNLLYRPDIRKLLTKTYFDRLICVAPYQWPYSNWITQFKYQYRFDLAGLLSYLLGSQWVDFNETLLPSALNDSCYPKLILPVPIHVNRWKNRGFNQTSLMVKQLSKIIEIDCDTTLLNREKDTPPQVGQPGKTRRKNIRNAFNIIGDPAKLPAHVILVDDVITTGATANEISRLLKIHGVKEVTVLAICLSLPKAL